MVVSLTSHHPAGFSARELGSNRGVKNSAARQRTYLIRADTWIVSRAGKSQRSERSDGWLPLARLSRGGRVKTTNLQTRKLTLSVSSSSFIVGAPASGSASTTKGCSKSNNLGNSGGGARREALWIDEHVVAGAGRGGFWA